MNPPTPAVLVENLSYSYPDGSHALRGVSFSVAPDEKVGLVGANGAGKSTLLLNLNGVLAGAGRIEIFGTRVGKGTLREVRKKVGLVFQNPDDQLFLSTLYGDVAFGPRNMGLSESDVKERTMRSLATLGLAAHASKSSYHLSLGQKKRAAAATVLSMGAPILALDEPTGGLDPKSRRELVHALQIIGGAQIVATHDFGLVKELCGRVIILLDGTVAAEGEPEILLNDTALLERCSLA